MRTKPGVSPPWRISTKLCLQSIAASTVSDVLSPTFKIIHRINLPRTRIASLNSADASRFRRVREFPAYAVYACSPGGRGEPGHTVDVVFANFKLAERRNFALLQLAGGYLRCRELKRCSTRGTRLVVSGRANFKFKYKNLVYVDQKCHETNELRPVCPVVSRQGGFWISRGAVVRSFAAIQKWCEASLVVSESAWSDQRSLRLPQAPCIYSQVSRCNVRNLETAVDDAGIRLVALVGRRTSSSVHSKTLTCENCSQSTRISRWSINIFSSIGRLTFTVGKMNRREI